MKAARAARRVKDLKGKRLSIGQQAVVRGGITDGTSNTLMIGEKLPVAKLARSNRAAQP